MISSGAESKDVLLDEYIIPETILDVENSPNDYLQDKASSELQRKVSLPEYFESYSNFFENVSSPTVDITTDQPSEFVCIVEAYVCF